MTYRTKEELKKFLDQKEIGWVREDLLTDGGEINVIERPYAKIWLENKLEEVAKKEKKLEKNEERVLNLVFLLIGALVATTGTYFLNEIDSNNRKHVIVKIIQSDAQKHVSYLESTIELFTKIKKGEITKEIRTVKSSSDSRVPIEINIQLRSNKSIVLDFIASQLQLVPDDILPSVLDFYRSLDYCEGYRVKMESDSGGVESSVFETYLSMMQIAVDQGKVLLEKIQAEKNVIKAKPASRSSMKTEQGATSAEASQKAKIRANIFAGDIWDSKVFTTILGAFLAGLVGVLLNLFSRWRDKANKRKTQKEERKNKLYCALDYLRYLKPLLIQTKDSTTPLHIVLPFEKTIVLEGEKTFQELEVQRLYNAFSLKAFEMDNDLKIQGNPRELSQVGREIVSNNQMLLRRKLLELNVELDEKIDSLLKKLEHF